jgi:hypothetical protein
MRNLIFLLLLTSCSKEPLPKEIMVELNGASLSYQEMKVKVDPFCGRKLYSLSASNRDQELLLISVVCDSLVKGSYGAGLSYWGAFTFSDDIILNVTQVSGRLAATFGGKNSSGIIK